MTDEQQDRALCDTGVVTTSIIGDDKREVFEVVANIAGVMILIALIITLAVIAIKRDAERMATMIELQKCRERLRLLDKIDKDRRHKEEVSR